VLKGGQMDKTAIKTELLNLSKEMVTIFGNEPAVLRAYPKSPAALNVMHAHAKFSMAM
jgi:hypothetical protein